MTNDPYWSGWRAQDRTKGLLRTMVAHCKIIITQIHKNGNRDGKVGQLDQRSLDALCIPLHG